VEAATPDAYRLGGQADFEFASAKFSGDSDMSRFLNCALSPESLAVVGRELDGMFEQLFGAPQSNAKGSENGSESERYLHAAAHIWEKDDQLFVQIELPGVKKEDVSVTFQNGSLEISAPKHRPDLGEHKAWHNTIASGVYKHRIAIGDKFNADSIEAALNDGVLRITVQKKPEVQPRRVEIQ
jgi:HSP20 family protein